MTVKLGYDSPRFYAENDDAITGTNAGTSININLESSKNFFAKELDTTKPVCSLNSASPSN